MQPAKLRGFLRKLGFVPATALLTAVASGASVAITVAVMAITGDFDARGVLLAACVPMIVATLMSLQFLKMVFQLDAAEAELKKLAITDELTGIYNRRYFLDSAEREMARALRFGKPFSCILLDIDGFKRINDGYGHNTGDEILKAVASTCLRHCRKIDTFARYGGDEFYFLLPECTQEEAKTFAERIRWAVERIRFEYEKQPVPVTASLGVQTFKGPEDSLDRLLIRTDSAMYAAKQAGKNKVSVVAAPGK